MRQNMYCHNCSQDFSVDIDMSLNGNHVFNCPYCEHQHCRVVKNGEITGERWSSRNNIYNASSYCNIVTSTTSYFLTDSWSSTSTATAYY